MSDKIRSMAEFQERFFPNDVGVKCPCCGETIKETKGWTKVNRQNETKEDAVGAIKTRPKDGRDAIRLTGRVAAVERIMGSMPPPTDVGEAVAIQ